MCDIEFIVQRELVFIGLRPPFFNSSMFAREVIVYFLNWNLRYDAGQEL